jgi:hypothetical protein
MSIIAGGVNPSVHWIGALVCSLLFWPAVAKAQLRIVTWNTATGNSSPGYAGRQADFNRVLDFIGREEVNGIAKPIDVLILQEQSDTYSTTDAFAAELNTINNGTSDYVAWSQNPFGTDGLDTGFVYNSATVTPFLEDWFGTGSSRATSRLGLTPVGYSSAPLYLYSTHHTAGTANGDLTERRDEAFDIRIAGSSGNTNSGPSGVPFGTDATGSGHIPTDANIIFAGDFNQKSSFEEPAGDPFAFTSNPYEILKLSTEVSTSGAGQAVDPIGLPGNWFNNSSFASIHTQSPHDGSFGLVGGGMDDRFDFQMITTELNDGEGISYIGPNAGDSTAAAESYHTFGNNGTTFNAAASSPSNTGLDWIISQGETLPGLGATQTRNAVRTSLARASDHSPVVADYQLPSVLDAVTSSVPSTLNQGEMFNLTVTVSNLADVLAAFGADELDYTLSVTGDLIGGAIGTDQPLGSGNDHAVTLDTSTTGPKSGVVTVVSSSLGEPVGMIDIPIAYSVVAGLAGDFDMDEDIDAADIDLLAANQGSVPPIDTKFDLDSDNQADFVVNGNKDNPLLESDSDELIRAILGTEYGDLNLDIAVNSLDLSVLVGQLGTSNGWANGNLNGDAQINSLDLSILVGNLGFDNNGAGALAETSNVPEPASGLCLAFAGLLLLASRRTLRSGIVVKTVVSNFCN